MHSRSTYLYGGSGNRLAMQATINGTTTKTAYIGSIEEVQTAGSTTQTTTYYAVGGQRIAANVNGTFYYFGADALGSQVVVLKRIRMDRLASIAITLCTTGKICYSYSWKKLVS